VSEHPRTPTTIAWDPEPDLILLNGRVVTVDRDFSVAEAVAIKDGRIVGVGNGPELRALAGRRTETVDLGGRMVLPGFIDSHCHPYQVGQRRLKVDLMGCRSIAAVLEAVAARVAVTPPGRWVEAGLGWREDWLAEKRVPTREELDRAAPDHPVYLPHLGYLVVLNSAALRAAGITRDTPDPPGGTIGRDAGGEPNGVLIGIPAIRPVERIVPPPSLEDRLECLRFMCRQNVGWGKTGAVEAGLYPEGIRTYQVLRERGELPLRTTLMLRPDTTLPLDEVLESIRAWGITSGFGDDLLRIGGIKLFLDGGIEGALLREPYAIDPTYYGQHTTPPETVRAIAHLAAELGWTVGAHACGGRAMDILLDVYEEVDREIPIRDRRWVLFHGFFPTERNFEQCRRLGIVVGVQQTLLYNLAPNFMKYWSRERTEQANPQRAWLDQGIRLAGGIDGTPFPILLAIWSSVTRGTRDAGVVGPEQRITREEAIRMYTIGSAYMTFEEHTKGSLEPGKLADLIVLDRDILRCPEDEIRDAEVLVTLVGGRVVHGDLGSL
jgi:predicted amidohydrolase YtcJ